MQLATGGGKTIIFSELSKHLKGSTCVLVHRDELKVQSIATLKNDKIDVQMVETLNNKIKKGFDINSFDNLIIDECHRGEFIKIIKGYNGNVIGFTATPNYEKNIYYYICPSCGTQSDVNINCCNKKSVKYKHQISLSRYYKTLIQGIDINELIEKDYLVRENEYKLEVDTTRLVFDPLKNDFTEESKSLVFGSPKAISNTYDVYNQLAKGKKTIIFNPNTIVNQRLFEHFIKNGVNAKIYDTKNSEENRKDLVEWFKNTSDAVLMNVQVFTTGFDVDDVEVIFLNKKTNSLNLYIQMVGRGGRITEKIFKDKFDVIDMGNNIRDLGSWSEPRNWETYFTKEEIKPIKEGGVAKIRTCHNCESIQSANSLVCSDCGEVKKFIGAVTGIPTKEGKISLPKVEKIIEYCIKKDADMNEARKIVYDSFGNMFVNISKEKYIAMNKEKLRLRTKEVARPYYFAIQKSKLKGNIVRTYDSFINEIIKNIERRYE